MYLFLWGQNSTDSRNPILSVRYMFEILRFVCRHKTRCFAFRMQAWIFADHSLICKPFNYTNCWVNIGIYDNGYNVLVWADYQCMAGIFLWLLISLFIQNITILQKISKFLGGLFCVFKWKLRKKVIIHYPCITTWNRPVKLETCTQSDVKFALVDW